MKCPHCGTEWSIQRNTSQAKVFCPGCGKPLAQKSASQERMDTLEDCLRYLFQKFGEEPFQDGRKLVSLHSDLMPQRQKDRRLLTILLNCGGHTALLAAKQKPKGEQSTTIVRLAKKMEDDWMIKPDVIREVISAFWLAVGGDREALSGIAGKAAPAKTPAPTPQKQRIPANAVCRPEDYKIVNGVLKKYSGNDPIIRIPDGVQIIGEDAFSQLRFLLLAELYVKSTIIKQVYLPDGVHKIEDSAFKMCTALRKISLPDSVTSIGNKAFFECSSLTSITIPDSVTSIGYGAFESCTSLTSITIPGSITAISGSFSGCSGLTSVTILNGVTSIDSSAFAGCSSLTSITIPNSVTSIGYGAFCGCSSLSHVTIPGNCRVESSSFPEGCTVVRR